MIKEFIELSLLRWGKLQILENVLIYAKLTSILTYKVFDFAGVVIQTMINMGLMITVTAMENIF